HHLSNKQACRDIQRITDDVDETRLGKVMHEEWKPVDVLWGFVEPSPVGGLFFLPEGLHISNEQCLARSGSSQQVCKTVILEAVHTPVLPDDRVLCDGVHVLIGAEWLAPTVVVRLFGTDEIRICPQDVPQHGCPRAHTAHDEEGLLSSHESSP